MAKEIKINNPLFKIPSTSIKPGPDNSINSNTNNISSNNTSTKANTKNNTGIKTISGTESNNNTNTNVSTNTSIKLKKRTRYLDERSQRAYYIKKDILKQLDKISKKYEVDKSDIVNKALEFLFENLED